MKYEQQAKAYVEAVKTEFTQINEYNNKVISFGYVAFFAVATFVKDQAPRNIFLISVIMISISMTIFVIHEICRSMYFNRYTSSKAKAIEGLPDNNMLTKIDDTHSIALIRFQKYNFVFFWISFIFGLIGISLLFCCYINMMFK